MNILLDLIMRRFIKHGRLDISYPDGRTRSYGSGVPHAAMQIRDSKIENDLVTNPARAFGEAYMQGDIQPIGCSLYDLVDVYMLNAIAGGHPGAAITSRVREMKRVWTQYNPATRSRRNVAHHYDLNGRLYSLFLDRDRQYSCAYFARGDETLEEAQDAKKHHIAAKLQAGSSGAGGARYRLRLGRPRANAGTRLRRAGHRRDAVDRAASGRRRAPARAPRDCSDRVRFELVDYRSIGKRFDRIVSVGMFEHVGIGHFETYLREDPRLPRRMTAIALVHSIGRADGAGATNAWLDKYIFPGGYSPALSETFAAVERSGLLVNDCEILRLHYAKTIAHWRRRFAANRDLITALYDERFCRMFELYLTGSEIAFRRQRHINFQIQLTRRIDVLPLTRDYMVDDERAHSVRHPAAMQREAADAEST